MNILILEDEQRNFNRLRRQLEEIDTTFHVEGPLANIQESVEWLRTHPTPDLILADIRLSDGLSFDVLRQTAIPSPIIFTTAYDEYAIQAFKYNSFDYLLKPINSEELAEAINKVRRRTLSDTHGEDMRRLVEYMYRNNYRYRAFPVALPGWVHLRTSEKHQPYRLERTDDAYIPERWSIHEHILFIG